MPFVASSTKTPEYSSASVVPSWVPKCTTSPWLAAESAGFTIGSCERVDVSSTPSPATHTTHLQHTKVEVALSIDTGSGRQVGASLLHDAEGKRVKRVKDSESAVGPVDVNSKVVPHAANERSLEQQVESVIPDFEEVGVFDGQFAGRVGERRA